MQKTSERKRNKLLTDDLGAVFICRNDGTMFYTEAIACQVACPKCKSKSKCYPVSFGDKYKV